jgi:hypothetical protein
MKKYLLFLLLVVVTSIQSQNNLLVSILNTSHSNSITCATPVVSLTAITNSPSANLTYFWAGSSLTSTSASININIPGVYTLAVNAGSIINTQIIAIGINTIIPTSNVSPLSQAITCGANVGANFVNTASSPTVNVSQKITSPLGGALMVNTTNYTYNAQAPGVYTNVITNQINGCSVAKTFTVTSLSNFPSFSLITPQNFTLGCSTKSVGIVAFTNPISGAGGASTYTVFNPGSNVSTSGPLSNISTYSFTLPGYYTAVMRNSAACESIVPFTVIQNTIAPILDTLLIPTNILDCNTSQVMLTAISSNTNFSYLWKPSSTLNIATNSLVIYTNTSLPTLTMFPTCTLVVTDNNNFCLSQSTVQIYQNLAIPIASIAPLNSGQTFISCSNQGVVLANTSRSNISPFFSPGSVVVAQLWLGPSPGPSLNLSSTYTALVAGTYTMVAQDLGNGCVSQAIYNVFDNRVYPIFTQTNNLYTLPCLGGTIALNVQVQAINNYTYNWVASPGVNIVGSNNSILFVNTAANYTLTVTDPNSGCKSNAIFGVWQCTGINEKSNYNSIIKIKPNPSNGIFAIEKQTEKQNLQIQIFNSLGSLIQKNLLLENETKISLQEFSTGIYFIKLFENENLLATEKIIIE